MSLEPIYQLKISAEYLRMSLGLFCFLMFCLIGGTAFVIFKMLIPSLAIRPVSFVALTLPTGMIVFLVILGIVFYNQFNRKNPLVIQLYKEGVKFEDSQNLVPYKEIQISRGKMEGLNLSEGVATSMPLGDALIFKIDHFDSYFNIGFLKKISPQYIDKNTYKVPIGIKGLTDAQVADFIEIFKRISPRE